MSLKEIIQNRRNVKPQFFTGETLSDDLVKEVLESANWAPTHRYTEPWRFVVFTGQARFDLGDFQSKEYKDSTSTDVFDANKFEKLLNTPALASHVIAVIAKNSKDPKIPFVEEIAATSCAVQNMLLTAASMEVAVHWSSGAMTQTNAMKSYLGYDSEDAVIGFLYLGKCDHRINRPGKRLSEIVDKTSWR